MSNESKNVRWPVDYIEQAAVAMTRESFVAALREFGPARESVKLLTESEIDCLFQETCDYLKKHQGIRQMRAAHVPEDLQRCERLMRPEEPLSKVFEMAEQAGSTHPFTSSYARELLDRTRPVRVQVNEDWSERLRHERFFISRMNTKSLREDFSGNLQGHLTRFLRTKKHPEKHTHRRRKRKGGELLGTKTQRIYLNALMAAVTAAADQELKDMLHLKAEATSPTIGDWRNRVRQQRSRATKAGLVLDDEVYEGELATREMLEKEKQKSLSKVQAMKKQKSSDRRRTAKKLARKRPKKPKKSSSPRRAPKKRRAGGSK